MSPEVCLHERFYFLFCCWFFFKLVLNQNHVCVGVLPFHYSRLFDFNNELNGYTIQFFNLFSKIVPL